MDFEITEQELEALKLYKNEKYISINQLLESNIETDIELLSQEHQIDYSAKNTQDNINILKEIYNLMKRISNSDEIKSDLKFFKSINSAEIEKMKSDIYINRSLIVSKNKENIEKNNWGKSLLLEIDSKYDLPFINLSEVLKEEGDEILLSPFVKIENFDEIIENEDCNEVKIYRVDLNAQELDELPNDENNNLYNEIINKADEVNAKLKACVELDNENAIHYENIRKLEQLLAKHNFAMEQENYDIDTTEAEKQSNLDDISRITLELNNLKDTVAKVYEIRKQNIEFISDWKKDVVVYLMSEFKKISNENMKNEEIVEKLTADPKESQSVIENNIKQENEEIVLDPEVQIVKNECLENIDSVNKLIDNIRLLISKQQNHARIAELVDARYKALNNGFEMKNFAEELESLLQAISSKIDNTSREDKDALEKISKVNIQISTLINYLNNPKNAVSKKVTRFEEIMIIEENELKREIAETSKNIMCEAEIKKLNDDKEIIEERSAIQKFFGIFTGKNKINEVMLEQIEVRQNAIKKTFKTKMPLAYNYSMHEIIAKMDMFIKDNKEDDLVLEDVNKIKKIEAILKKNFVIIDEKVKNIIDNKIGKDLPMPIDKMTKAELIEIDTYRFLKKYDYDKSNDYDEPQYQDTLANEIKRIVDYAKSSGIL